MTSEVTDEDVAGDDDAPDVPWQRLSLRIVPAALLRMLVRLVPAAVGWWFFNTDNDVARFTVGALAALAVLNPLNQALNYLKVRYRLTGEELQHTTGLLVRRSNRIALHRIRTVDITAPLSNRLFGLAVLRVGTGGNAMLGEGTVALDGLPRASALALRAELLRRSEQDVASTADPRLADAGGEEVQTLRWRWVVYQMFGTWLFAGPLSVIGTIYGFVSLLGREEWVGEQVMGVVDRVPWGAWAAITLVLLVLLGVGAGAVAFAEAWWGYRLVREPGGRFLATRGLLTTRSFTADQDRMRGVTVGRGLVTRLLGGARLSPVMTGVSLAQMMTESSTLLPTTTREVAVRVANVLLGSTVLTDDVSPASGTLRAHPPVARRRAVVRYLLATAAVAVVLGAGVWWAGWSAWLLLVPAALVPIAVVGGRGYYAALGHRLDGEYLYLQRGFFSRRTDVVQVRGINGAQVGQSPVQRLLGLATLTVTTAAGEQAYYGVDMALRDATALADTVTEERVAV
ncbi:PH domain-containing protein [Georgenia phoenicis]|uniref:PH domain-containing protein n=1 Tax=unclassified Georgenia TaxID=2626815 RepID=UPI0039B08B0E